MESNNQQPRLANPAAHVPESSDYHSPHNSLSTTNSNSSAWTSHIWGAGTPSSTLSSAGRENAGTRSSGWNSGNGSGTITPDARLDGTKIASTSLEPSLDLGGWNRRNGNASSLDTNGNGTSSRSRYADPSRLSSSTLPGLLNDGPSLNGQYNSTRTTTVRPSDIITGPLFTSSTLPQSKSVTDLASFGTERDERFPTHPPPSPWGGTSAQPSPVDERRSNFGSEQYFPISGSYRGSLPPSRNGADPSTNNSNGNGTSIWTNPQRLNGSAKNHTQSNILNGQGTRSRVSPSLPTSLAQSDLYNDFERLHIFAGDTQLYPEERQNATFGTGHNQHSVGANIFSIPSLTYNQHNRFSPSSISTDFQPSRSELANGNSHRPFENQYSSFGGPSSSDLTDPATSRNSNDLSSIANRDLTNGFSGDRAVPHHAARFTNPMVPSNRNNDGYHYSQDSLSNVHLQHFLMAQNRTSFANGYPAQPEFHMNNMPTYRNRSNAPHVPTANLNGARRAREAETGPSMRSELLEEFKKDSKNSRRYELKDVFGHVVEFSGDQHGSRFIQSKLETANSEEKERVFRELLENAVVLMQDVFGNYVVQKLFEHGDQNQKKILANKMKGQVLRLSMQVYGCRVVQKAIDFILVEQQAELIQELDGHVIECVKDQNGNHVIQKAIEKVPLHSIRFIIDAFHDQVQRLALHPYGCRVVQRLLERCEEPDKSTIMEDLHACGPKLISDQYGNYVTQHIIEHGSAGDRDRVMSLIRAQFLAFSRQKYASNVVETSIQFATDEQRRAITYQICEKDVRGEMILQSLIKDAFGNYVIQKLLDHSRGADYDYFVSVLEPEITRLRRASPTKHVDALYMRLTGQTACRPGQAMSRTSSGRNFASRA